MQVTSDYLKVMDDSILPFAKVNMPIIWAYQQDNGPIHASYATRNLFSEEGIRLMTWPTRSPELDSIKNVYAHVWQFNSSEELWNVFVEVWNSIPANLINSLVSSMNKSVEETLELLSTISSSFV